MARCWQVGAVRVTRVVEQVVSLPLAGLLPDATPEALGRHAGWLVPDFVDDAGTVALSIHSFVLESEGHRILVDTCLGDREIPGFGSFRGDAAFLDRLARAGHPIDAIDLVLCTHLHFDHVGWNTRLVDGRWVPTFPSARYVIGRREHEHWHAHRGGSALNLDDTVAPLLAAGVADLVDDDHRLTGEVRLVPTPGHSPGHVSVLVESGGARAVITGDATHHPVQWAEPSWVMVADSDGAAARQSRLALRAEHGRRGSLVLGTHYPDPSAGWIDGDDDTGYRFEPEAGAQVGPPVSSG